MNAEESSQDWQEKSQEASKALARWRQEHPKATLAEIERAVDEQMNNLRARLIEDVAQGGQDAQTRSSPSKQTCPVCGTRMQARGKRLRTLQTQGGQEITLKRTYSSCPTCGYSFSPLDEQLGLTSSALTPHAHSCLVRLGAWMPFEQAAKEIHVMLGIQVSDSTVRRLTLETGAMIQAIQTEQAMMPSSTEGFTFPHEEQAERLAMSCDGGMVPLRGGMWAEVKTLVIGEVVSKPEATQEYKSVRTRNHSYFSRLADAVTFADLASVEIMRRGVDQAKAVCAVQDGADWLQGFVEGHRHDAVRILDFAHAAHYLGQIREQCQRRHGSEPKWN